ncbi:hypothetical protein FMEXI_10965 [Fusarium mexicanum]|uniref:Uncharacterized protein n=1 Tax=Fusarium mexicanum TaxID=751941 RepID=A0A8H5MMZ3_9HYPO|nr:hypothetical protein FMEXI_10965 [Fusarium mexicanum]
MLVLAVLGYLAAVAKGASLGCEQRLVTCNHVWTNAEIADLPGDETPVEQDVNDIIARIDDYEEETNQEGGYCLCGDPVIRAQDPVGAIAATYNWGKRVEVTFLVRRFRKTCPPTRLVREVCNVQDGGNNAFWGTSVVENGNVHCGEQ